MKTFFKWLLILALAGAALFFLFPILILMFIGWQASTHPPKILSQIEPNLDFVNSKLEFLYFDDEKNKDSYNLYIGTIDGKSTNLISDGTNINYNYNYGRDKIVFIKNIKDKIKSSIVVYNLKNKTVENTFDIDRRKYNGHFDAPTFSPDDTSLLYTINDKDNSLDFTFIVNLHDKSTKLAFMINEFAMYGNARWDINSKDIWMYQYRRKDKSQHYYKYVNPLQNTVIQDFTDFNKVSMAKILGLRTYSSRKGTPFENRNDSEFVLKENNKVLVKYDPGIGIDSIFNIDDFDYSKDMKYLLFCCNGKIYICDIKTGKIGYLADGNYPRFTGNKSSVNTPSKSFYDLGY